MSALSRLLDLLPGRGARRRARVSEQRLGLALEVSGMALWELDAASGAMWWSEGAGRLLGAGPSGPHARLAHVLQCLHPEDRPAFQAAMAHAIAHPGEPHTVEARAVLPGGEVRWLEARGRAFTDGAGRLSGLRGSLVDVTEAKRSADGFRRSVSELQLLAAVAETIAQAGDEPSLLARTTTLLRDAFFPDNCGFLLLDQQARVLRHAPSFHARRGSDRLEPIPLGRGVVGTVAQSGVARRVDDVASAPEYVAADAEMRSEICVALRAGSRVLGVFDAESCRKAAFTADDERLLQVVAVHVAGALERLRAAEALRESSELYRAYFTASPVALFVSGTDGRYLEVNGAACALTGYSADELLRLSVADLLEPGEAAAERGERLLGLLSLGGGSSEIRVRRRDGSTRHCLVHASALGADRLLGILLDISDRREAEERLKESEERFRSLSEASLEAIFIHEGGRIVDANQALCALGGYSWHELVGRDGFELIAPEYRETVYRNLLAEHQAPYEIEALARDGSRLGVEVQARSFPYRGKVLRVVAVRDLTARRQAAAQRESLVRELEARNVELERFGYAVAHDLKAPLVTAKGFADHLERDVSEGRSDRIAADARRIRDAVDRVQRLVEELAAFSRAVRPVGPPVAVATEALVHEALRLLAGRCEQAGVRLELVPPLPVVYGDRARLVQVFRRLLEDAAASPGARDTLVRIESRGSHDGKAALVVRRTGASVAAHDYDRLLGLEPAEARHDGPRVGLSLVKRVLESHGGRLWAEHEPEGPHLLLCFTLPLPPDGAREAGVAREGPARLPE